MFNPHARWDRHLPYDEQEADVIEVGVIFKQGKILPSWFVWKDRKYTIQEITYHWTDKHGDEVFHFFSVTDGANLYQIYLNNKFMHWRLAKTCPL